MPAGSRSIRKMNSGLTSRACERGFDARLEPPVGPAVAVELQQTLHVGAGHRPPVGAAGQRRQDPARAAGLFGDASPDGT